MDIFLIISPTLYYIYCFIYTINCELFRLPLFYLIINLLLVYFYILEISNPTIFIYISEYHNSTY